MKSVPCLATAALLLLTALPARATSVVALDDRELVEASSVIGVVQVLRTHIESSPRGVFTVAELQVYQGLKGVRTHDVLAVQVPGGPMGGGMVMRVAGAPQLHTGQLFLAFLHEHGGVLKPTAMSLGMMPIIRDADGVSRVVQRTGGLSFVDPDGSVTDRRVQVNNQPLKDVLEHFRGLIEPPRAPVEPPVGGEVQR